MSDTGLTGKEGLCPQESYASKLKDFISRHSENIAGWTSLAGSTALIFNGDVKSIVSAGIFTAAELTLARFGHTTAGYALGAALFAAGDLALIFSSAVQGNLPLQISLAAMAAAWTVGALRYPFEKAAQYTGSESLQKTADALPAITGSANLLLRLPGIFTAAAAGNYVLTGAIAAWGAADILAGRLQERVAAAYSMIIGREKEPEPM